MSATFLCLFRFLCLLGSGHQAIAVENLALRRQLAAFRRKRKRPILTECDRLFWIGLSRVWSGWKGALVVGPDSERLSKILRRLTPRQEKVVGLHFGLGCKRPHSVGEIAAEFGVATALMTGILNAATKRLAESGVTIGDLKEAAREPTIALRTHSRHRQRRPE